MYILTGMAKTKDPAAANLGKKGGLARAKKLTRQELSQQGRNAVLARWEKWRKENPEKIAGPERTSKKKVKRK
jgi:hypothetical protein